MRLFLNLQRCGLIETSEHRLTSREFAPDVYTVIFLQYRSCDCLKRLREIALQVIHMFQPDVEPDDAMAIIWPVRCSMEVISHDEAGNATPAISNLEQLKRIHKPGDLLSGKSSLHNNREHA